MDSIFFRRQVVAVALHALLNLRVMRGCASAG
jgi:hypothetical protein